MIARFSIRKLFLSSSAKTFATVLHKQVFSYNAFCYHTPMICYYTKRSATKVQHGSRKVKIISLSKKWTAPKYTDSIKKSPWVKILKIKQGTGIAFRVCQFLVLRWICSFGIWNAHLDGIDKQTENMLLRFIKQMVEHDKIKQSTAIHPV